MRSALALTGIGLVIGRGMAAAVMQGIKSLRLGISPLDPIPYIAVPLVRAAAGALARYLPARCAAL